LFTASRKTNNKICCQQVLKSQAQVRVQVLRIEVPVLQVQVLRQVQVSSTTTAVEMLCE